MTERLDAMGPDVRPPEPEGSVDRVRPFCDAGVLGTFETGLVATFARLVPAASGPDLLALGLVARATRSGHVCVAVERLADLGYLDDVDDADLPDLEWPVPEEWEAALSSSPLVAGPDRTPGDPRLPLVLDDGRLYLQRYWAYEVVVAGQLRARGLRPPSSVGVGAVDARSVAEVLDLLFGPPAADGSDRQRVAADRALRSHISVIAGGPGTGKTHTIARVLAAAQLLALGSGAAVRVALVAPTGKAAMRMGAAVQAQVAAMEADGLVDAPVADGMRRIEPSTIHRLLVRTRRSTGDADDARFLPFDLVVVDETSMVALPLMAELLQALAPTTRVVLVGDPFQLASIEAGTVMDDVVGPGDATSDTPGSPLAGRVTVLDRRRRFEDDSGIAALAEAIRSGDGDATMGLLRSGRDDVHWVAGEGTAMSELRRTVVASSTAAVDAALEGDAPVALAELERVRVLAAIRPGPDGRFDWSDRIEGAVYRARPSAARLGRLRIGTPIMVTGNDRANGLFNGDVGILVDTEHGPRVAIDATDRIRLLPLARLGAWETWWAMTIHKSQGSEFDHAVVSLPAGGSRILSRELLYTAVTRARTQVTVVGSEEVVRLAVDRPITRASGLRDRLWPGG